VHTGDGAGPCPLCVYRIIERRDLSSTCVSHKSIKSRMSSRNFDVSPSHMQAGAIDKGMWQNEIYIYIYIYMYRIITALLTHTLQMNMQHWNRENRMNEEWKTGISEHHHLALTLRVLDGKKYNKGGSTMTLNNWRYKWRISNIFFLILRRILFQQTVVSSFFLFTATFETLV